MGLEAYLRLISSVWISVFVDFDVDAAVRLIRLAAKK